MKKGFTLIELLVVIAIIAILASILFPVFGKAREKARQTTCISNQKQIATAVIMYTTENDDALPGDNWTSEIGVSGKVLVCPNQGKKNQTSGYIYNIILGNKKIGEIDGDQSTIWLTADGTNGEMTALDNGDWRHGDNRMGVSYLDGHVTMGYGTNMDTWARPQSMSNITFSAPASAGPWNSQIYMSKDGKVIWGTSDGIYIGATKILTVTGNDSYENVKVIFNPLNDSVLIVCTVNSSTRTFYTINEKDLFNGNRTISASGGTKLPTNTYSMMWDGTGNFIAFYDTTIAQISLSGRVRDLITGIGSSSSYAVVANNILYFSDSFPGTTANGDIRAIKYSELLSKNAPIAVSDSSIKIVATGFSTEDGTAQFLNANANGDLYISLPSGWNISGETMSYMIRGDVLYSVLVGKRTITVTPKDTKSVKTFSPDISRDDWGMPGYFVGNNLYIVYKDDGYNFKVTMFRGN